MSDEEGKTTPKRERGRANYDIAPNAWVREIIFGI